MGAELVSIRRQTKAVLAHVPFERSAFDVAREDFSSLPQYIADDLTGVDSAIARFNALALYDL